TRMNNQIDVLDRPQSPEGTRKTLNGEQWLPTFHHRRIGLHRLDAYDLPDVGSLHRLPRALDGLEFRFVMEPGAQGCEEVGKRREATGYYEDDSQHDCAQQDVELVWAVLAQEVVEQRVDEGADGRAEEGPRAAKECNHDRLRVLRPVKLLRERLLLEDCIEASRYAGEGGRDSEDGQFVGLDVDPDRASAL